MRVEEVAHKLVVFKSYVYKIVKKLNQDLKEKGYMTISGWVNRKYFQEKPVIAGWEGIVMAVYKEEKTNTWRVIYRYATQTGLESANSHRNKASKQNGKLRRGSMNN